jgi:uncharacterized protein (DUF1697 family)
MPRYVAFLRGVSPMNCRMPELARAFEAAGFTAVRTLLSSGNVAFDAKAASTATLAKRCEDAMTKGLGRSFGTIVRSSKYLQDLLASDPYRGAKLPANAKAVVTFLRETPGEAPTLPIERDGARVLKIVGTEVFTYYTPSDKGPVFMKLLERTFGKDITTRTLDTVRKCAAA